ncbi:MAG: phosphoglycerate kinase, partial [Thermoplasmata archaeon]
MVKSYLSMDDFDLTGKTIFLRLDINSPIDPKTGDIMDYSRFKAHLDTIRALDHSKVVIIAHQSRPGKKDFTSLYQHSLALAKLLKRDIKYIDGLFDSRVIDEIKKLVPGDILMLENTRFYAEEVVLA